MPKSRSSLVIAATLALSLSSYARVAAAECSGDQASLRSRTAIAFTNAGASALTDHLAVVTVDTASLVAAGKLRADAQDVRFTDSECNPLGYWLESGANTSKTRFWVKVPEVPVGTSTIFLRYDAPAVTRQNDAAAFWGDGIAALYTFTEGEGTVVHDWVGGKDLTASSAAITWQPGPRAGVQATTGFTAATLNSAAGGSPAIGTGEFSVVSLVRPTANDRSSTRGLIGNYTNDGTAGWILKFQGGNGAFMMLTNQAGNWCQDQKGTAAADTWTMLTSSRANGATELGKDGVSLGTICAGDQRNVDNAGAPMQAGRGYNNQYALEGRLSFQAIYTKGRTAAQNAALYASLALGSDAPAAAGLSGPSFGAPKPLTADVLGLDATFKFGTPGGTFDGGAPDGGAFTYTVTCKPYVPPAADGGVDGGDGGSDAGDAGADAAADGGDAGGPVVYTKSGNGSPITMTLPKGQYSCSVRATDNVGDGPSSPTILVSTPVDPPADGGSSSSSSGGSSSGGASSSSGGGSSSGTSGTTSSGGVDAGAGAGEDGGSDSGCSCDVVGVPQGSGALVAGLSAFALILGRRRRNRTPKA